MTRSDRPFALLVIAVLAVAGERVLAVIGG